MASYSGSPQGCKALGQGHPFGYSQSLPNSDYQDESKFARESRGIDPNREIDGFQGMTGQKQLFSTIPEGGGYHTGNTHPPAYTQHATGFTSPDSNMRNEVRRDWPHSYEMKPNTYTDLSQESTGYYRRNSATLRTLKPTRFEMPNHPSYHGQLNSKEAEQSLMASESGNSCYLIRYSKSRGLYVLSVVTFCNGNAKIDHIKINIDTEQASFGLDGTLKIFRNLDELLKYYENNPLSSDIRSIGSVCFPPGQCHYSKQMWSKNTGMTRQDSIPNQQPAPSQTARMSRDGSDQNQQSMQEFEERLLRSLSMQQENHSKEIDKLHSLLDEEQKKKSKECTLL